MNSKTTPSTAHYRTDLPPTNQIIYHDNDIVVANKQPGLLSVPGKTIKESLFTLIEAEFNEAHVAHRLDCETSGIMVFARNKASLRELHRQFREGLVEKEYEALGYGICSEQSGEINLPLITDWPNRPKQKIDFEQGKPSKTRWELMEVQRQYSRFALYPITGRSHQLRVHLQALGHPILGDKLYAKSLLEPIETLLYPNMCLHARKLIFTHPVSGATLCFTTAVPF